MFRSTIVFLVLLRLAIGWHFFFEGLDKIRSRWIGKTETNRPFSSAGYFREATGPLGPVMRGILGDPNEEARAYLVPRALPAGGRMEKPAEHMPPGLNRDWDDYVNRFVAFYELDEEQKKRAQTILQQAKDNIVSTWLAWRPDQTRPTPDKAKASHGIKKVKKVYPGGEVEIESTVAERRDEYLKSLADVRDQSARSWYFGKDVEKQRLAKARADVEQQRADLLGDLDKKTTELLKRPLAVVLTGEQKASALKKVQSQEGIALKKGLAMQQDQASLIGSALGQAGGLPNLWQGGWVAETMVKAQEQDWGDLVPAPGPNWKLTALDSATAYGLTALGACLLLGLLTRLSSFLLAGFLLMTYLAVPAFPWLPVPPNTEGNYYYVNKNLIEMLALLVLTTVPSGRWLGLDALFHSIRIALFGEPKQPAERARPEQPAGTPTPLMTRA